MVGLKRWQKISIGYAFYSFHIMGILWLNGVFHEHEQHYLKTLKSSYLISFCNISSIWP